MINIEELIKIMQINGLNNNASITDVDNLLNLLRYSEENKKETIAQLKARGWLGGQAVVSPVQSTIDINRAVAPSGRSSRKILLVFMALIILLIGGGFVFAYVQKIGPFAIASYSEKNLLSSLLAKANQINTLSYSVSGSLNVNPRDKDAESFTPKVLNDEELKLKYKNDILRLGDATQIISQLNILSNYSTYAYLNKPEPKPYPTDIKNVIINYTNSKVSLNELLTKKGYDYRSTAGGKNFALTINFETDNATKVIKNSNPLNATSTTIVGKQVTFTKDSSTFMYMSDELPKPFLVQMSESLRMLPPDIKAQGSFSMSSDLRSTNQTDWTANLNAEGDFGDLSYKVNADVLKKGQDYYFKINNIPSLFFLGDLSSVKGKWVNLSTKSSATSSGDYSIFSSLEKGVSESESKYKENREKSLKLIKKIVAIADEENIIYFKKTPRTEKIAGRTLVKYELGIKKEKILPFYRRIEEEISKDPDLAEFNTPVGEDLVKYLESEEFNEAFAYFDKNVSFVFWADSQGFPAIFELSLRVVPPDTATQLKDKQINIIFKTVMSDINKALNIEAPTGSIPLQKIIDDIQKNQKEVNT